MANQYVLEITESNFQSEIIESKLPVLVDFWAEWCGPCRLIAPIIDELAEEYAGKFKVAKVNVDKVSELAAEYGIMSIPTIMFFKDGQPVDTLIGARPKEELQEKIDELLG